jgi:stage II sporulation protein D
MGHRRPPIFARHRSRRAKRLATALVLAAVAAVGLIAAGLLPSCIQPETPVAPGPSPFPAAPGVPTIRVKLTSQPVGLADVSCSGGYRIRVDNAILSASSSRLESTSITRRGRNWAVGSARAAGGKLVLESVGGSFVRFGGSTYRGKLYFIPVGVDDFIVVNHVDLESYLAGVLAKELYPNWQAETYRALAIAARTFAIYQMYTFGPGHDYDIGGDQSSQVYGGLSAETTRSRRAVAATHGLVLAYGRSGDERVFQTQYSSCCGGVVNPAGLVQNSPAIPPLAGGQKCEDCSISPRYRWDAVLIPKSEIFRAVAAQYPAAADLRGVAQIQVVTMTTWGRPAWVDVVGTNGKSVRIRAEDLRVAMLKTGVPQARQLYSMNCVIRDAGTNVEFSSGRGYGHGAGLCQWGAQGKALKGWSAEQIVAFYYPKAVLIRAY